MGVVDAEEEGVKREGEVADCLKDFGGEVGVEGRDLDVLACETDEKGEGEGQSLGQGDSNGYTYGCGEEKVKRSGKGTEGGKSTYSGCTASSTRASTSTVRASPLRPLDRSSAPDA